MTEHNHPLLESRRSLFAIAALFFALSLGSPSEDEPRAPVQRTAAATERSCFQKDLPEKERSGSVVVQFGDDLPAPVRKRITAHLRRVARVTTVGADEIPLDVSEDAFVISVGDTAANDALLSTAELEALQSEGYVLRSGEVEGRRVIGVDGDGTAREGVSDVGAVYGAYALLEHLGFGFLHPLEPTRPADLPSQPDEIDRTTAPRWKVRGLQLHTMHPLELTDLLQGWGPGGPDDADGWEAMVDDWDTFLEWMLANGQNRVHWVWLAAESWGEFAASERRIRRIEKLLQRAHAFGIEVGLDVPLRLQQQHAARLIRDEGDLADERRQIERGVAHVMGAGFDYLVTESGSTEVTAPDDRRMLAWMNALTETAADHGVPVFIKVHASTGQLAENFEDPETGGPINFNFLPHHADKRLGVLPHSVQHYALDDPAPTYGNQNFGHIREFLQSQAGRRPTVWHPETAYWVSFDNDVPLFLPVYASRRVRDLRLLGGDEEAGRMGRGEHAGARMDGQLTFSSGWEWGYWLQEVVTARAAWDPHLDAPDDDTAYRALLEPVARVFGDAGAPLRDWIVDYSRVQRRLLIEGRVGDGELSSDVTRRNGQAYLQGFETWDDVADHLADGLGLTHGRMQPDRLNFAEIRAGDRFQEYDERVAPLLEAMESEFTRLLGDLEQLRADVPPHAVHLYEEIVDSARITALRARQVRALYAHVVGKARGVAPQLAKEHLRDAQAALDEGLGVVAHRETHYRVSPDRIAGWRDNPTVYPFTYLWTVRSLYYWQRDEAQAIGWTDNPCLYNIIDPVDVGLGAGDTSAFVDGLAHHFASVPGLREVADCMRAPSREPDFLLSRWPSSQAR